jgi:hypothetical protein
MGTALISMAGSVRRVGGPPWTAPVVAADPADSKAPGPSATLSISGCVCDWRSAKSARGTETRLCQRLPIIAQAGVDAVSLDIFTRPVIETAIAEPTRTAEHEGGANAILGEGTNT